MTKEYCNCGDVARNVWSKGKDDPTMCGLCNKEIKEEVTPLDLNYKCGCFHRIYLDMNNRLNAGLGCCKKHVHAYAKASDFSLSLEHIPHEHMTDMIEHDSMDLKTLAEHLGVDLYIAMEIARWVGNYREGDRKMKIEQLKGDWVTDAELLQRLHDKVRELVDAIESINDRLPALSETDLPQEKEVMPTGLKHGKAMYSGSLSREKLIEMIYKIINDVNGQALSTRVCGFIADSILAELKQGSL